MAKLGHKDIMCTITEMLSYSTSLRGVIITYKQQVGFGSVGEFGSVSVHSLGPFFRKRDPSRLALQIKGVAP